jgi:mxaL protein
VPRWALRRETPRWLLSAALLLALSACFPLGVMAERDTFTYMAIVDITRSMNVEDYRLDGRPANRLEFVKHSLRNTARSLPCGSRLGLGVFTERQAAVLFDPIEVCSGFAAIDGSIEQLDWRMAWAADSRIADGFFNTLELLKDSDADLVFLSDGQEAPPANPRYRPSFAPFKGKARGVIVGAGSLSPTPIPKFDEFGKPQGYYSAEEVPQRSTFGEPTTAPDQSEEYHARNAPFGKPPAGGTEHLSSLKEDYLIALAAESGFMYRRLAATEDLSTALTDTALARRHKVATDMRWLPAGFALAALLLFYLTMQTSRPD